MVIVTQRRLLRCRKCLFQSTLNFVVMGESILRNRSSANRAAAATTTSLGLEAAGGHAEHNSATKHADLARFVDGHLLAVGIDVE